MQIWIKCHSKMATLLFAAGLAMAVTAVQASDGSLNTVSFKEIPAGSTISVRPWDNSDANIELVAEFETALRAKGYRIDKEADYILSFETRDILGTWSAGDRRSVIELQARGGRTGGEDAKAMLNLFESQRGGVLNPGRPTPNVINSKYQVDATIDKKAGGRIWQGQATAELKRSTGLELTKQMIPGLVGAIGQTIKQGPLQLR